MCHKAPPNQSKTYNNEKYFVLPDISLFTARYNLSEHSRSVPIPSCLPAVVMLMCFVGDEYAYIYMCVMLFGWLVVLFYGVSTLFGSFNAELSHFDKSFKQFNLV